MSHAEGAYGRFGAARTRRMICSRSSALLVPSNGARRSTISRAVAADPRTRRVCCLTPTRRLAATIGGSHLPACAGGRDPQALNALGYFYAYRGYRIGLAVELLQRALQLAPEEGAIIDSLGWALYQRGDLTAAIRQLRRAVAALPGDAEVRFHFGVALARAGLRDPALVELGKAARQDPKLPGVQAALRQVRAGRRLPVPLVPPGVRRPSAPDDDAEEVGPPAQPREAPLSPPRLPRGRTT